MSLCPNYDSGLKGVCPLCGKYHISKKRIEEIASITDQEIDSSDIPELKHPFTAHRSVGKNPLLAADYDPDAMRRDTGESMADIAREVSQPIPGKGSKT